MALFGSKKKTDTDAAPVAPVAGAPVATGAVPAPDVAPAPAPTPVVKEKKARPAKGSVKNGSIVGLNIGNSLIKAVEVSAKNGQVSVTRIASVPTPPDAYQNGVVLSVSALANAIKALWKTGGFKGKAVISSISGTGSLVVRVIEVPLMTDAQLADAMRADAQLYIPFPPTEVQMDFKALRDLPTDPDAGTMDVLLAAAQSEIIDAHVKTLQAAKLDPRSIDVEPIAAGRTLALQKRGDFNGLMVDYNEITAVVNIGASGTEISLLRGDALVFTRTVSTGGNTLSQSIADALGVPLVEGERIKLEQGDALPPEGYQQAGGNDFGGDFGGDFDDFGLSPTPTVTSPSGAGANRTTVLDDTTQSSAPPASTDPFDLDFFNQGQQQNEPGAGHSQKEGEPNPNNDFGFSFDNFDDAGVSPTPEAPKATPPATETPATPSSGAANTVGGTAFNFDFDMSPTDLPTSSPTPAASTPSSISQTTGEEELPDDFLPSFDTPASTPIATAASAPTPIPSAFDFSDFDLPATASASGNPVTAGETPIAPAAAVPAVPTPEPAPASTANAFSFDDLPNDPLVTPASTAETPAPAQSDFSFGEIPAEPTPTEAPLASTTPVSTDALDTDALDMDDVFATTPVAAAAIAPGLAASSPEPAPEEEVRFDDLNLSNAPNDGLNLGGVGEDPFGFGTGDEFTGFGAGLSAGPETEGTVIYEALANALEEMAGEISRSLSFYLERVPDVALSRIYITGGGALLKNLDVYLTGRLGAPTSTLNPLQLLPVATQSELPNGPLYTVALGLALRDFVD